MKLRQEDFHEFEAFLSYSEFQVCQGYLAINSGKTAKYSTHLRGLTLQRITQSLNKQSRDWERDGKERKIDSYHSVGPGTRGATQNLWCPLETLCLLEECRKQDHLQGFALPAFLL